MKFSPCTGNCTEDGTHCQGCGRSHEEIAEMRENVMNLIFFAKKMGYENIDEFADSVSNTIKFKLGNPA